MKAKDKIKVLFDLDDNGYIAGYQHEFYDGKEWQTPFDTTNAIEVTPADLASVTLGASRVSSDGIITTDAAKQAELEEEAKPVPTAEQQMIAMLSLRLAQLEGKA